MKLKFILHGLVDRLDTRLLPESITYIWKQTQNPSQFGYTDNILHKHYDPPPTKHSNNQGWYEYRIKKL